MTNLQNPIERAIKEEGIGSRMFQMKNWQRGAWIGNAGISLALTPALSPEERESTRDVVGLASDIEFSVHLFSVLAGGVVILASTIYGVDKPCPLVDRR